MEPRPESGLVERDDQLGALLGLVGQASAGTGSLVHLLGPAGVGKTSLLRAVSAQARARGLLVLEASAGQLDAPRQFGLVRRLFDRAVVGLDAAGVAAIQAGPARRAVGHLLGGSPTETGLSEVDRAAPPADEADLIASFYWLLANLASTRPVLAVVDDLQWADVESLHFLGALRERLGDIPAVVLTATRESNAGDRSPPLAWLLADRHATTLRLQPLTVDGVATLLAQQWEVAALDATVERVAAVSGGNPFLVMALAHHLAGLDPAERTAARVATEVPHGVIDAVIQRLADLPESDRALAQAMAVLDSAPTWRAAALAGLDLETAAAAADRLRDAGLFAAGPGLGWEHALVGAGVAETIGVERREQLHRQAARLLAAEPGGDAAAVGHLMASSGVGDPDAVELLATAAARAHRGGAPHTAVSLLRRAIAEPAQAETRGRLLLALGEAEATTADPAAIDTLGLADRLLATDGERRRCALVLARVLSIHGRHEEAADLLERAGEDVACAGGPPDLEVEAALVAAELLVPQRIASARRRLAARRGLTGVTRGERLFLLQQLSDAVGTNQPAATIRELAARVVTAGRHEPDSPEQSPESTEWVWVRLYLVFIGDYAEAQRQVDAGIAAARERGSVIGLITTSFVAGHLALTAGAFAEAEARFRTMADVGGEAGGLLVHSLAVGGLAPAVAMQGRVEEALDLLAPFPEDWPVGAPVNGVAAVGFGRAVTRHLAGDHEGALRAARSVGEVLARLDVDAPTWAAWRAWCIEPLLALGQVAEARLLAAEHLARCEAGGVAPLLADALRLGASTLPDPAASVEQLRRAVEVAAGSEARFVEGHCRVALGAALRRVGNRRAARAELRTGHRLIQGSGAVHLLRWAEAELLVAGARRGAMGPSDALTPAERRVAELAADGLGNRAIAQALFLSVKTIESHLSSAYRKLGITGRDDLPEALLPPS